MTSKDLRDKLNKALEKVKKCENTIERHQKQLSKKQEKLLRVEWTKQYLGDTDDTLHEIMWDEEKRAEYKRVTGDDLYWDCCDVQHKYEDIKGAKRKMEDAKRVANNWREKLNKQVEKEIKIATVVPEAFKEARDELVKDWTEADLRLKEKIKKAVSEMEYKAYSKMYPYSMREYYLHHSEDDFRKYNERDADEWLLDLYNRVVSVTGEITDASNIRWGGKCLDGYIVGKEGKAVVETIQAGGYNIQRLHLRTLVKDMK